jgi:hypothetical protein
VSIFEGVIDLDIVVFFRWNTANRAYFTAKCKHDFIQLSILALEFDYDQELADMLQGYGYHSKQKLLSI